MFVVFPSEVVPVVSFSTIQQSQPMEATLTRLKAKHRAKKRFIISRYSVIIANRKPGTDY